jgi:hypothetical protein
MAHVAAHLRKIVETIKSLDEASTKAAEAAKPLETYQSAPKAPYALTVRFEGKTLARR